MAHIARRFCLRGETSVDGVKLQGERSHDRSLLLEIAQNLVKARVAPLR
jgi:hypothetical protein